MDNQYNGENPQEGCIRNGVANYLMSKYTANSIGYNMNVCNKCRNKRGQETENAYVVIQSPKYMASVLKLHP